MTAYALLCHKLFSVHVLQIEAVHPVWTVLYFFLVTCLSIKDIYFKTQNEGMGEESFKLFNFEKNCVGVT